MHSYGVLFKLFWKRTFARSQIPQITNFLYCKTQSAFPRAEFLPFRVIKDWRTFIVRGTVTKRGVSLLLQSRVIRRSKCWMTTEEVGLLLFLVNGCSMTSEAPRRCFATYRRIAVVQGHQSHYCKSKNQNNDWRHLSVEVLHTLLPTLSEYHKQFLICNFLTLDWRSSNFYGVNVWVLATFGSNILRNWRGEVTVAFLMRY